MGGLGNSIGIIMVMPISNIFINSNTENFSGYYNVRNVALYLFQDSFHWSNGKVILAWVSKLSLILFMI